MQSARQKEARLEDASAFTTSLVHVFFLWKVVHTVLTKGLYVIIHIHRFHDLTLQVYV
ncbi:hypothetical protein E2C01_091670 [Portunus trituberculatus]|uniref:Uncharacterized protein n=1 Tax=Portunus trituberculatus TaxID=210409 RepID=A0A5B7JJM6_PORTR|nr:hypothetical protein [Portunus trituberculatus]